MDFVNFDLLWLLPVGCYIPISFYTKLLLSTIAPLVLIALLFMPRAINAIWLRLRGRRASQRLYSGLGLDAAADVRVLLVFTFWIFSSVSTTVLATFACDNSLNSGSYLRADYSVQCNTYKHKLAMVYSGIMILVYPAGIPLLYSWALYRERKLVPSSSSRPTYPSNAQHVPHTATVATTEFLWEPYKDRLFFWETCECMRRLLLTGECLCSTSRYTACFNAHNQL
jgi:hypothetical protein